MKQVCKYCGEELEVAEGDFMCARCSNKLTAYVDDFEATNLQTLDLFEYNSQSLNFSSLKGSK